MINKQKQDLLVFLANNNFGIDAIKAAYEWLNEPDSAPTQQRQTPSSINASSNRNSFSCFKSQTGDNQQCVYVSENGISFLIHPKTEDVPQMTKGKVFKKPCQEVHAIADFDSVGNTRALAEADPESPAIKFLNSLGGDWYIPALGVLCIIGRHVDEINKVLEEIEDAELIGKDEYLLSSNEYNAERSWSLDCDYINTSIKVTGGKYIRPVSAIIEKQ